MRGEGWQGWRGRKPSQHCTAISRITLLMMFCSPQQQNVTFRCAHMNSPLSPTFDSTQTKTANAVSRKGADRRRQSTCGPAGLSQNKGHFRVTVGAGLISLPTEKALFNVPPTRGAVVAPWVEGCWFKPQGAELMPSSGVPCIHPHEHQPRT